MGIIAGIVIACMNYKELKKIAESNGVQTCKYKKIRQKLKYIMRELNKIEVHTMTIFLKKRKVDTFEKQQHIMACLNQEVKEMKNRKGKIEIISVFLIPLLMNLVINFYSLGNLALQLQEYIIMIIVSLIKFVLPIWLFLISIKVIVEFVLGSNDKKMQLEDLIYVLNEILIFEEK